MNKLGLPQTRISQAVGLLVVAQITVYVGLMIAEIVVNPRFPSRAGLVHWAFWPVPIIHPIAAIILGIDTVRRHTQGLLPSTLRSGYVAAAVFSLLGSSFASQYRPWILLPSAAVLLYVLVAPRLFPVPDKPHLPGPATHQIQANTPAGILSVRYDPALWLARPGGPAPQGWTDRAKQERLTAFGSTPRPNRQHLKLAIDAFADDTSSDVTLLWCPAPAAPPAFVRIDVLTGPGVPSDDTSALTTQDPEAPHDDTQPAVITQPLPGWTEATLRPGRDEVSKTPFRRLVHRPRADTLIRITCQTTDPASLTALTAALNQLATDLRLG